MARQHDAGRRQRIDDDLKTEPWIEVARSAVYGCQVRNLKLKPWETPPCWVDDPFGPAPKGEEAFALTWPAAAETARRLIAVGASKYEPDPAAVLDAQESAV